MIRKGYIEKVTFKQLSEEDKEFSLLNICGKCHPENSQFGDHMGEIQWTSKKELCGNKEEKSSRK